MNKNEIMDILSASFENCNIPESEVPDIDLYMDQILTLMRSARNSEDEKQLTKTMINNYTKEKMLKPVKGKKYPKQHILFMFLIYNLKSVLTIDDIKTLVNYCDSSISEDDGTYKKEELIDLYCDCYNKYEDISSHLKGFIETSLNDSNEELDMFKNILTLCAISSIAKKSAEQLIKELSAEK